jgi:hypothetical protein
LDCAGVRGEFWIRGCVLDHEPILAQRFDNVWLDFFDARDNIVDVGKEEVATGSRSRHRVERQDFSVIGVEWLRPISIADLSIKGDATNSIVRFAGPL